MNDGNDEFSSAVYDMGTLMRAIVNPYGKRVIVNGVPAERLGLEESKATKADSIKGAIVVILFIGAIIAMAVFAQTEPILCMGTFGAVILIFGLINLFQSGGSLEDIFNLVFPLIGAVLVVISVVNVYHKSHPDSFYFTQERMIEVACIGFGIVGLGMLVIPPVVHSRKMRECTQVITAMCIYRNYHYSKSSHKRGGRTVGRRGSGISRLYKPWWQYEVNGTIYVSSEGVFTNVDVPDIGDLREIRFSPEKPSKIYRPLMGTRVGSVFLGVMCIGMALLALVVMHR
jgi:hypothetical protein